MKVGDKVHVRINGKYTAYCEVVYVVSSHVTYKLLANAAPGWSAGDTYKEWRDVQRQPSCTKAKASVQR
jgi:hypothetical protein